MDKKSQALRLFTRELSYSCVKLGAGSRIRTDDLLITNQLLYQLSYAGIYYAEYDFRDQPELRFSRCCSTVKL